MLYSLLGGLLRSLRRERLVAAAREVRDVVGERALGHGRPAACLDVPRLALRARARLGGGGCVVPFNAL